MTAEFVQLKKEMSVKEAIAHIRRLVRTRDHLYMLRNHPESD